MSVPSRWRRGRLASIVGALLAAVAAAVVVVVPATVAHAATGWKDVSAGYKSTCGVKTDDTLWCWGDNTYGQLGLGDTTDRLVPTRVGTHTTWRNVTVGREHACA